MLASTAMSSLQPGSGPIPTTAGIGLRFQHHEAVADGHPHVGWLEVHAENYFGGGTPLRYLDAIRRDYPVSLHGIGLSLGGVDALDGMHLDRLRALVERVEPGLVSEHLAWTSIDGVYLADLLPLPMTEEALGIVCDHVAEAQDHLRRRILVENPSTYLRFAHSAIPEPEFLGALAQRTGCGILCDVNNVYVSACNHGFDARAYLDALPATAVGEIHVAGHAVRRLPAGRTLRIDDHGSRVAPEVWALHAKAIARFGRLPTLVEWDTEVPALDVLLEEAARAQAQLAQVGRRRAAA
jgi:uncharacterized protein (UPF0276 family)